MKNREIVELKIAIAVLKKYKIAGSEPIIESLSQMLVPSEDVKSSRRHEYHHLLIVDGEGEVISTSNNKESFILALRKAGINEIYNLSLKINNRPFITKIPEPKYRKKYRAIENELYIHNISSAKSMKPILETVSEKFGLNWTIYLK